VVPRPGIDADTLNAGGGGRGDAIAGDDHAGGTVIDDGHVVVRSVADDAERVAGHRDRTARAPAAFEFFQAQNCMPVSGAMNACDGMPEHVVSRKKEEREGTMPSLARASVLWGHGLQRRAQACAATRTGSSELLQVPEWARLLHRVSAVSTNDQRASIGLSEGGLDSSRSRGIGAPLVRRGDDTGPDQETQASGRKKATARTFTLICMLCGSGWLQCSNCETYIARARLRSRKVLRHENPAELSRRGERRGWRGRWRRTSPASLFKHPCEFSLFESLLLPIS